MNAYYKGQPVFGPRGPAGPDGNPIGTVISYMGLAAPQDYLVCDGTAYSIVDYPELAAFFAKQFGSANHFGGDGEATFAVPDLRNLFLRGFHGGAEEQLSGDIGAKQEATQIPNIYMAAYGAGFFAGKNPALDGNWPAYTDKQGPAQSTYSQTSATVHTGNVVEYYTTRPVNMAVLCCIKAVESAPMLEEYDTANGWHVRKWSDGYVEMVNTFDSATTYAAQFNTSLFRFAISTIPEPPLEVLKMYKDDYILRGISNATGWLIRDRERPVIIFSDTSVTNAKVVTITREITGRWK